jgi:ribosomal protein S17E
MGDYVQGTVLHYSLQKLIFENFDKLEYINKSEHYELNIELTKNHLLAKKNLIKQNGFTEENLQNQLEEYSLTTRAVMINNPFPTRQETSEIDSRSRCESSMGSELLFYNGPLSVKCGENVKTQHIKKYLRHLSLALDRTFIIDFDSNTFVVNASFNEPSEKISGDIQIYTIALMNKEKDRLYEKNNGLFGTYNVVFKKDLFLVYCKYNVIYGPNNKRSTGYCAISLLDNNRKGINKYGIYTYFLKAGIFVCKPFEYTIICEIDNDELCGTNYMFVGDRYASTFPFNKFAMDRGALVEYRRKKSIEIQNLALKENPSSTSTQGQTQPRQPNLFSRMSNSLFSRSATRGGKLSRKPNKKRTRRRRNKSS